MGQDYESDEDFESDDDDSEEDEDCDSIDGSVGEEDFNVQSHANNGQPQYTSAPKHQQNNGH